MSPEQVLGEEMVDARSDVYSLGCMIVGSRAGAATVRNGLGVAGGGNHPKPLERRRPGLRGPACRSEHFLMKSCPTTDSRDRPA
jgi:serine/threonine protein kinase